jgi:hypothetical protein
LGDIQKPKRWATIIMQYSHSHPWDKPAKPTGQTDSFPTKNFKKLNYKQGI